ncbi:phospholipid-transporting ATPase ABCA3 [Rhipicephalus sanguineus]|nr:phospholipid-transporting ATPase ABCA3 [Rhipicephalus sanguineus]
MAQSTATEALAICCPDANEHDTEVPSWSDLLTSDVSLIYDVGALVGCAVVALLLLSLGDAVVVPLVHSIRYLAWRKAGPSTTSKVAAIEASGLMSPVNPAVFAPPLRPSKPQHPSPTAASLSKTPTASASSSSLPTSSGSTTRVTSGSQIREAGQVVLEAAGLERRFGGHYAVRDVSLSVRQRECVGLLGQSGAGKSTTLRMLSGELLPTAGASVVYGNDLRSQRAGYVTCVGYQPSTGGYVPELTARQHLELLAVLRRLPHHNVDALVGHVLRLVDLDLEADKKTQLYCRSSLRKLGLAMALLGAPRLLLLDAPTSGIDPITARSMWHTVDAFTKANNQAVVLATTLIPECLALCSRVIVLSGGEQTWSGAVANLRNTFFMGMVVTVTLTIEQKDDTMSAFLRRVNEIFEGEALAVSKTKNVVRFKICDPLYSMRSLKRKLALVLTVNVVREVDFGHVALHKLFGIEEPE